MGFWDAMVGVVYKGDVVVEVNEKCGNRVVITKSSSGVETKYAKSLPDDTKRIKVFGGSMNNPRSDA